LKLYKFVLVGGATKVVEGESSSVELVTSGAISVVLRVVPETALLMGGIPDDSAGGSVVAGITSSDELGSSVDVAGPSTKVVDSPAASVLEVIGSSVELGTISVVASGSPIEVLGSDTTSVVTGGSSTDVLPPAGAWVNVAGSSAVLLGSVGSWVEVAGSSTKVLVAAGSSVDVAGSPIKVVGSTGISVVETKDSLELEADCPETALFIGGIPVEEGRYSSVDVIGISVKVVGSSMSTVEVPKTTVKETSDSPAEEVLGSSVDAAIPLLDMTTSPVDIAIGDSVKMLGCSVDTAGPPLDVAPSPDVGIVSSVEVFEISVDTAGSPLDAAPSPVDVVTGSSAEVLGSSVDTAGSSLDVAASPDNDAIGSCVEVTGTSVDVTKKTSLVEPSAVVLTPWVSVENPLEEVIPVDSVSPDTALLIGGIPLEASALDSAEYVVDDTGASVVEGTCEDNELEQPPSVTVSVAPALVTVSVTPGSVTVSVITAPSVGHSDGDSVIVAVHSEIVTSPLWTIVTWLAGSVTVTVETPNRKLEIIKPDESSSYLLQL
jgi:hypothetical protein